MRLAFTVTQKQRLTELDLDQDAGVYSFDGVEERDRSFKKLSEELVHKNKLRLTRLRHSLRPLTRQLETQLANTLNAAGFVEVVTPTTMSKGMLDKMGITEGHPLRDQIYWLGNNSCLRPMLAPNLYYMLERLGKVWPRPLRIFEIGQCFRKESKGAKHLSEFTMLNLVEMGIPGEPYDRLVELAGLVMDAAGLGYNLETEESEVYGSTLDVVAEGVEIASGATGPHSLDDKWNITESWAGLGFGLERIVMVREGSQNIRRVGRSLIYLDGARLNI